MGSCASPDVLGVLDCVAGVSDVSMDEIWWHDVVILEVDFDPEGAVLRLRVDYPVNWEQGRYELRDIVFIGVQTYQQNEGQFAGCPTILSAAASLSEEALLIRLETNAGYRSIRCRSVELMPCATG
ncbi:hypothetical protein L6R52_16085 [Myxococcota bacterium]|nr:hypothetical protein [Myxococcota bacterium]